MRCGRVRAPFAESKPKGRALSYATGLWSAFLCAAIAIGPGVSVSVGETITPDEMFQDTCARCHGTQGFGDGSDGTTLATHPRNFHNCDLMSKDSDDTVFKEIKGGSVAIGRSNDMPAWGAALTDDEIRALLTYVRDFCKAK